MHIYSFHGYIVSLFCVFEVYGVLQCQDGFTALTNAVTFNTPDMVEFLLKNGADVDVKKNVSAHSIFLFEICLPSVFRSLGCFSFRMDTLL